jgi:hypothetical protein
VAKRAVGSAAHDDGKAETVTSAAAVSVIIPNYNYGDYVGAAIQSALDLDWPDVEVIVVDDGSTDHSRRVIAGFGSRVRVILQRNSGQLVACNEAFFRSRGEIVIFLDSDDLLAPSLLREVAAVWSPRVSKVQVQMRVIDAAGQATGNYYPQYSIVPSPAQARAWLLATGAYPSPPGSGNVYARWFLQRIFPLHETCGKANDTYSIAAAPLLGDVITIAQPLASYRVHGRNQGALATLDVRQFERQMTRALQRQAYAAGIAAQAGLALRDRAIHRSLAFLAHRMASLKLSPSTHTIEGDTLARVLRDFAMASVIPQGFTARERLLLLAWACAVAVSPGRLARRLVAWRFAAVARPRALRRVLAWLKVVAHPSAQAAR